LTIAEIAEELRCSPATIRSWISQGALAAMRPGKRKLLVRRSELDRMLAGEGRFDPGAPESVGPEGGWREMDVIQPPGRSGDWPAEAVAHVSRSGWLGVAESEWRAALRRSAMATPNEQFALRLQDIAQAAARKAAALANMIDEPGMWWQRQSAIPGQTLSYELRPGASRPGPAGLWVRVDATVGELSDAMASHSATEEQLALERLSLVLHEIVDALMDRDMYPWPEDWAQPDENDRDEGDPDGPVGAQ
jgi:excisionase family DNA binding protein